MPNIWSINDHEDESKSEDDNKTDTPDEDTFSHVKDDAVISGNLEDDLEKPSFLRRLSRKKKEDKEDSSDEAKTDDSDSL